MRNANIGPSIRLDPETRWLRYISGLAVAGVCITLRLIGHDDKPSTDTVPTVVEVPFGQVSFGKSDLRPFGGLAANYIELEQADYSVDTDK